MQIGNRALLTVGVLCMTVGIARANLILNPSFESPMIGVGSFENFATGSTGITNWTVTGPSGTGVSLVNATFAQNGVSFEAEQGNQWLDLTGDGSNSSEGIEQTVATTVGSNYVLTFYIGNTTGGGIFGTASTAALDIDGSQVSTFTNRNPAPANLNWEQFTYTFTAATASTTIGFANLDPSGDNSNGLDMVDLELGTATSGPNSTPEPASIWLVASALMVAAGRSIRRSPLR